MYLHNAHPRDIVNAASKIVLNLMKLDRREPTPAFNKKLIEIRPPLKLKQCLGIAPLKIRRHDHIMSRLKKKLLAKNNFEYSNGFHKPYYTKQATLALTDMKTWSYHVEAKRNILAKDNLAYSNGFTLMLKPCYTKQASLAPKRWVSKRTLKQIMILIPKILVFLWLVKL